MRVSVKIFEERAKGVKVIVPKGKPIDLSGNEFACRQCRNLYCTCPKPVDPNLGRLFCPNCNHEIETKGLIGRLLAYQSKTHNGGRPRSAIRCQCGVMTLARAIARGGRLHNATRCKVSEENLKIDIDNDSGIVVV